MSIELVWLLLAALAAGLVDAVVGGGGLLQVPALFTQLPGSPPAVLFGTNKVAAVVGTAQAAWRYARAVHLPWRILAGMVLTAVLGSWCGAHLVTWLSPRLIEPLVVVLLVLVLVYVWRRPQLGLTETGVAVSHPRWRAALLGGVVGVYDGFFGPGTGMWLIFGLVRLLRWDFLRASAAAKWVNVATNVGALSHFLPQGLVLWEVALWMALANGIGAWLGVRWALRYGVGFVRRMFLVLALALILRLLLQVMQRFT